METGMREKALKKEICTKQKGRTICCLLLSATLETSSFGDLQKYNYTPLCEGK